MRRLIAFVVLLVVAVAAYANSLSSAVQQLDADCAARIAAIGSPAATRKLKSEAVNLNKVRTQLAKYTGGATVKDLRTIAKAGPMLLASRTQDPAILADVDAVLDCLEQSVDQRFANAQEVLDDLLDPKNRIFIRGQMTLAKSYFDAGKAALPKNPALAAAWFVKAYDLYGYNKARAERLLEKEQGNGPPAGVTITSTPTEVGLANASGVDYDVAKIRVFASVESGATTVETFTGQSAKSLVAGFLAAGTNHMPNATTFDLYDSLLIPLATATGGAGARIHGRLWVFALDPSGAGAR